MKINDKKLSVPSANLKVGEFTRFISSGLKNDEGTLYGALEDTTFYTNPVSSFCKIEKVVHAEDEEDFYIINVNYGNGGWCKISEEESNECCLLVTLVIYGDKYYFVDAEGYNYPRYVLFNNNFEKMYAFELLEIKKRLEYEKELQHEREVLEYNKVK
jgi:hypothetical protein